jgi:hypothetical protein
MQQSVCCHDALQLAAVTAALQQQLAANEVADPSG